MARRLHITVGIAVLIVAGMAPSASAEEFAACWTTTIWDPLLLVEKQITRCRISGGQVVDYANDDSVPGRLYPHPGTDLDGACWYYSSLDGNWRFAQLYANGDALLGYSSGGAGGGFSIVTGRVPRCTSEPVPADDPEMAVWDYIADYIHDPPTPELNPEQGDGITGLETFVGLDIPDDHSTQLDAGTTLLDIEIEVAGITIEWGDGLSSTYPARNRAFAGYPDGIATHVYEEKGTEYSITTSFEWTARWRVSGGGSWQAIAVPDTSTTVDYPVDEIVSVITG